MLAFLGKSDTANIALLAEKLELPETEIVRHLRQLRKAGFAEEFSDETGQGGFLRITGKGRMFLQEKC